MNRFAPPEPVAPHKARATGQWDQLMAAAQGGDRRAYERLLREVVPFVRGIARRHSGAADRLDDIVQEVLLSVHRVRHTYDPTRPFTHWLAAIAHRRSIDALRREGRVAAVEVSATDGYETFADPRANRDLTVRENLKMLTKAIVNLAPGQRRAVELLSMKEMSLAEAAHVSGQSEGALKVSLHRAVKSLRVLLRERLNGQD